MDSCLYSAKGVLFARTSLDWVCDKFPSTLPLCSTHRWGTRGDELSWFKVLTAMLFSKVHYLLLENSTEGFLIGWSLSVSCQGKTLCPNSHPDCWRWQTITGAHSGPPFSEDSSDSLGGDPSGLVSVTRPVSCKLAGPREMNPRLINQDHLAIHNQSPRDRVKC